MTSASPVAAKTPGKGSSRARVPGAVCACTRAVRRERLAGMGTAGRGLTRGRSMSTCIPSPGPMWATWLKLVGLEIILDLSSGSRSISLGKSESFFGSRVRHPLGSKARPSPGTTPGARTHRRCCSLSSSGTLKTKRRLLRVRSICFLLLSEVSGTLSAAPETLLLK